jgi:membrane protease subunit HflC
MRTVLIIAVCVILILALRLSLFTVDRTEYVYVTQFGRPIAVFDGESDEDAGLHVKWPWPVQNVQRLDHRLQQLDLQGAELLTRDPKEKTTDKTLTVDAYVCWRIAGKDGADRFIRAVGSSDRARTLLRQEIGSALGSAIAGLELDDLVSTEAGRVDRQRDKLRDRLMHGRASTEGVDLQEHARQEYGIDIVDIRVRRTNHPPAVREAIFARIVSERNKKIADYASEGERQAQDIASAAERKSRDLLAEARASETSIKGRADAEADRIRNDAFRQDPEFYEFLKKLDEYQRILGDNKSVLLLSSHRGLFDLLFQPPKPTPTSPKKGEQ